MYVNVAYTVENNPNLEDLSVPLRINNCGHYRVHTRSVVETNHPGGRNDYQLLYIASGKGHFYFQSGKQIVTKGNMVLYRPGEPQVYNYYAVDKTEVYWVHFTGSQVEKILAHYNLPLHKNVFFSGISPEYAHFYRKMIQELQLRRTGHEELLQMLFRQLLLIINRNIESSDKASIDTLSEIERAIRYFNENYNKPIQVEQYAKERMISVNWFIHCFKAITTVTPTQYILSLRISAAKDLLKMTSENIAAIAVAVGYDNPLYFSRLFKKHTGFSPTEYKKQIFQK